MLILALVFTASVFVRLPNLKNQPLGRHHEWITAHTLLTNKIWFEKGLSYYHYSPVFTYDYTADRTHPLFLHMEDENKNHYYVSYPPFGFYFPYAIFKITNIKPNESWIRGISLFIQFVSAGLIFLFVYVIAKRRISSDIYLPAYIAFILYVFCSGNLWYNGNLYFSDILVQPLFIGLCLMLYLFYFNRITIKPLFQAILFSLLGFLIVYTEWIGVFLIASTSVLFLIKSISDRRFIMPLVILPLTGLSALALTIVQYGSISSVDNFIQTSVEKFKQRSGADETAQGNLGFNNSKSYENIKVFYSDAYLYLFRAIAILIILLIVLFKVEKFQLLKDGMIAIYLSLLPVVMHIIVFFNFNIWHDFSVHKASFFLSLTAGILMTVIYNSTDLIKDYRIKVSLIFVSLAATFVFVKLSVKKYYELNDPNWVVNINKELGESIINFAQSDEAVFTNYWAYPELMFYSERNPFQTNGIKESIIYMQGLRGINKGIYFKVDNMSLTYIVRFNNKGDSTLVWKSY